MKAGIFLDEILYKKAVKCPKGLGKKLPMDSEKVSMELLTSGVALNRMDSTLIALYPSSVIKQPTKLALTGSSIVYRARSQF